MWRWVQSWTNRTRADSESGLGFPISIIADAIPRQTVASPPTLAVRAIMPRLQIETKCRTRRGATGEGKNAYERNARKARLARNRLSQYRKDAGASSMTMLTWCSYSAHQSGYHWMAFLKPTTIAP